MELPERRERETARDYAVRALRRNIVAMRLEPGGMVSENELATELGVSRTPVREALIELAKAGIVEIFPQHGSMVSRIDFDLADEAAFTRRVLETAVVREVCEKADEEHIRELSRNIALQRVYAEHGDAARLLEEGDRFHRALFVIAGKRLTFDLMWTLQAHYERVRALSPTPPDEVVIEDYEEILSAVRARDPDRAAMAVHMHLSRHKLDKAAIYERYARYFKEV